MKKHFKLRLMTFVALLCMVMLLITCIKNDGTLTIEPLAPTVSSSAAAWVGHSWATLKGTVNANSQSTTVSFEYDTTTAYGYSINADPDTMSGSASLAVSANISGLIPKTKYHYRVKAVNPTGTTYGSDVAFTTSNSTGTVIIFNPGLTYGSVSDIDGKTYKTIEIGTQTWMAENLRTTKYNNGTAIPFVPEITKWAALTTPGYCWYNNDSVSYGAMYNWYTVNTGLLCPAGWHVPTDTEWTTLTDYLGGVLVAGNKLKEVGTTHWLSSTLGASNESGFSAIPSGYRSYNGSFNSIRSYGYWWSSTESSTSDAYYRDLFYGYIYIDKSSSSKKGGFNIRCLKD
jgi:uncharacterized protein (TIGR02145 family)